MHDAFVVRGFECVGDLTRDRDRLADGQVRMPGRLHSRQSLRQRLALHQLKDERRRAVPIFQAVDRRDVRMIQRREDPGLALEARQALGIATDERRQHLESDIPAQPGVSRAEHVAHSA
jgi:hypothetical protein